MTTKPAEQHKVFKIRGADRKTGRDIEINLRSEGKESAIALANAQGIVVEQCIQLVATADTRASVGRQAQRASDRPARSGSDEKLVREVAYKVHKSFTGKRTISFVCEHCQTPLTSPIDEAGTTQSCPLCKEKFVVPRLAERQANERERQHAESALADMAREREVALAQMAPVSEANPAASTHPPPVPLIAVNKAPNRMKRLLVILVIAGIVIGSFALVLRSHVKSLGLGRPSSTDADDADPLHSFRARESAFLRHLKRGFELANRIDSTVDGDPVSLVVEANEWAVDDDLVKSDSMAHPYRGMCNALLTVKVFQPSGQSPLATFTCTAHFPFNCRRDGEHRYWSLDAANVVADIQNLALQR